MLLPNVGFVYLIANPLPYLNVVFHVKSYILFNQIWRLYVEI